MAEIIDIEETEIKPRRHRKTKKEMLMATAVASTHYDDVNVLDEDFEQRIKTDPKYSLTVDPTNLYNMRPEQIEFIRHYIDTRNVGLSCKLAGINEEEGFKYYNMFSTQQEIRRINLALKARQFSRKMMGINEVGGWLTSLLTEENVPLADRLYGADKLKAAKMLVELNELKKNAMDNPNVIDVVDIEENIKDLSVKSIKSLIASSYDTSKQDEKNQIIDQINVDGLLTEEELSVLRGSSKEELLQLLNEITGKE